MGRVGLHGQGGYLPAVKWSSLKQLFIEFRVSTVLQRLCGTN